MKFAVIPGLMVVSMVTSNDHPGSVGSGFRPFEESRVSFSISYGSHQTDLAIALATCLPGDSIRLTVEAEVGNYVAEAPTGLLRADTDRSWWWIAPRQPTNLSISIKRTDTREKLVVQMFVLTPAERVQNGTLAGYRIGAYPRQPLRGLDIYKAPVGFIEVTRGNRDMLISPHFRLRHFEAKQGGGFPRFVVVDPQLLQKLEYLLEVVNKAGYPARTFFVMSGYRTPAYNASLANVRYSRHVYGSAADIFIDERPRDGVMDDLDGNGRIDIRDAQVLVDLIDEQLDEPAYAGLVGGVGRYRANASHGPFVHVDVRDRVARWE